jgi:ribosome-interacting GTPase 1
MPANLTPQYKKVEEQFRAATSDDERTVLLEEMLRVIPKHKGTEHIQAELKRKLKEIREAGARPRPTGKTADVFHVSHGGAGQIALLGTPNCGKSSLVGSLTNAKVNITDFPFGTHAPVPGIAHFEDVPIQLVDMPPITAEFIAPGQVGTYRNCDLIGIIVDLAADPLEQMQVCLDFLDSKQLLPHSDAMGQTFGKEAFVIGTKSDLVSQGTLETVKELTGRPFEYIEVSAKTAFNLDKLVALFFRKLKVIRIYAKPPGKPADMKDPFTLPVGSTVMDLATHVHRELAEKLKTARAWGTDVYEGQSVHRTHVLHDKDIIELHFG